MWYTLLHIVILIHAVYGGTVERDSEPKWCPDHSEVGQLCESTCTFQQYAQNKVVTQDNCLCLQGYARDHSNQCVPFKECESLCEDPEEIKKQRVNDESATCVLLCDCKKGYRRCKGLCVPRCIGRGEIMDPNDCTCKCNRANGYETCNGKCVNTDCGPDLVFDKQNCSCNCLDDALTACRGKCYDARACSDEGQVFDSKTCACVCKEGFSVCNGECHKDCLEPEFQYRDEEDDCKCKCKDKDYVVCDGKCVLAKCNNDQYFDDKSCNCKLCGDGHDICQGTCVPVCGDHQVRDMKSCRCKCVEGYSMCKELCHENCDPHAARDMKTCQCVCDKGFSLCNGQCYQDCGPNAIRNEHCNCICAEGFVSCKGNCVEGCTEGQVFDIDTCTCTPGKNPEKCGENEEECNGKCVNTQCPEHKIFDESQCQCICTSDVICMYGTRIDPETCECKGCEKGQTFCKGRCVPSECSEHQYFDESECSCKCRFDVLCQLNTYLDPETCVCKSCSKGYTFCGGKCVPNDCRDDQVFDLSSCQCECRSDKVECNGQCVSSECNSNEFFCSEQCTCLCMLGYERNYQGICVPSEHRGAPFPFGFFWQNTYLNYPVPGMPNCEENEYLVPCPPIVEKTCQGLRDVEPDKHCFCKDGYIRDSLSNCCMRDCPLPGTSCETQERYAYNGVERFCGDIMVKQLPRCGYFCEPGWGRNFNTKRCEKC